MKASVAQYRALVPSCAAWHQAVQMGKPGFPWHRAHTVQAHLAVTRLLLQQMLSLRAAMSRTCRATALAFVVTQRLICCKSTVNGQRSSEACCVCALPLCGPFTVGHYNKKEGFVLRGLEFGMGCWVHTLTRFGSCHLWICIHCKACANHGAKQAGYWKLGP